MPFIENVQFPAKLLPAGAIQKEREGKDMPEKSVRYGWSASSEEAVRRMYSCETIASNEYGCSISAHCDWTVKIIWKFSEKQDR